MAIFSQGVLTKKGQALIAKSETRNVGIALTKAVTGSGVHADKSAAVLEQCTALISPKQEFAFSDLTTIEGNTGVAVATVVIHNKGLTELYHLNELGVYATDPDEGEILYMLLVSDEELIYLPPDNQKGGISTITERIYVEVTNSDQTTVQMEGALVSATDFLTLRSIVTAVIANLQGGTPGQMLVKDNVADYGYMWQDINTVTKPLEEFPEVGRQDAIYVDSDSAEIYIWKFLTDTQTMGYFKLPLGAEASATLQKQITANANNIANLTARVVALEKLQTEVFLLVDPSWTASVEDGIAVYKKELPLDGMTAAFNGTVYPNVHSTAAADIVEEMKSISTFFGRGLTDSADGKLVLTCYKKAPNVAFGICVKGA